MALWRLAAVAGLLCLPHLAASQCYLPNGTVAPTDLMQPCNGISGTTSMCCATNRTTPFGAKLPDTTPFNLWPRDRCLANGLCQSMYTDETDTQQWTYWRNFCSDPSWEGCLKDICPGFFSMVTPCADTPNTTKWCCGRNASTCCSNWDTDPAAVYLPLRLGDGVATNASSMVDSGSSPSSGGLSAGAKGGIAVGAVLGIFLLVAAVGFWLWRRRQGKKRRAPVELEINEVKLPEKADEREDTKKTELPGTLHMAELDGRHYHQLPDQTSRQSSPHDIKR